jgi:hypothetical protein
MTPTSRLQEVEEVRCEITACKNPIDERFPSVRDEEKTY